MTQTNLEVGTAPTTGGRTTSEQVAATLGAWSTISHGTLARRLAHAVRVAVDAGVLADGAHLPPERALATSLAVSRSTLSTAFDELRADGYLVSRQGSGSRVRGPRSRAVASSRVADHFVEWSGIDLAVGNPPDPSHLPDLSVDVADLLAYGGGPDLRPLGIPALRQAVADRLTDRGVHTDVDQIHITAGAHQAVWLTVAALAGGQAPVAVEDPSYPGIFDILDGLASPGVPVDADRDGLRPDALDRVLRDHRPALVYVQNGPHNPTGRRTPAARLEALAAVLDRHEVPVLEDLALADLTYDRRPRPLLAQLCRRAVVVTVSSVSKVGWEGLRIGWLRAPAPLVQRTMHLRLATDHGVSVPSQLLALQLLPHYDDLSIRRSAHLEVATTSAIARLADELPEWRIEAPTGGSVLWVETPLGDTGPFVQLAARHGVRVAPGSIATAGRLPTGHIRVCVDRPRELLDEGLRRLGLAWREHTG